MKKYILGSMVGIMLLCICCTGCSLFQKKVVDSSIETTAPVQHSTELNERQKEILAKEGLPTEWDDLNTIQRTAICDIEDVLQYMEKKYEKKFHYKEYIAWSVLNGTEVICYSDDMDSSETFHVTQTATGWQETLHTDSE